MQKLPRRGTPADGPVGADTAQAETWNGTQATRWIVHRERLDRMAAPADEHLFAAAAIRRRDRVLDIGCGTGATSRLAARRARSGRVVGIDLSRPMLAEARRVTRLEGPRNVRYERGDAQTHPFPPGFFDRAISRAGVMFFADPVEAFANIRRALHPYGRLAFLCHGPANAATRALFAALHSAPSAPPTTTGAAAGAAAFGEPERVRGVLEDAGFAAVEIAAVEYLSPVGRDPDDAAAFLLTAQLGGFFDGAGEEAVAVARRAVARALRPYTTATGVLLPAPGLIVTARAG